MITTAPRFLQFLPNPRRRTFASTHISAAHVDGHGPTTHAASASLYETLGLHVTASAQEIKAAYRRLSRTRHPDAGASAEEFMRIHAAYSTLSDPDKRADYDRVAFGSRIRPVSPFSGGGSGFGGRRRTWETDQCW